MHYLLYASLAQCVFSQSWKHYPFELEGNAELTFPAVEGIQPQYMSDSWFMTAQVTGQDSGKRYQLVTIFDRNYITAAHLNFYQVSVFDYETGYYNTFTEYDLPGVSLIKQKFEATPGSLDVSFASATVGIASWRNVRDEGGGLRPFQYSLECPGSNHIDGKPFGFQITADMQKSPVAVGASTLRGLFTFYAQQGTYSYFQPGPLISGQVTIGNITERVAGTAGHVDRQIFPAYSGIFTPTGRQHSHVWIQINLASGADLSIWRQFDRVRNNTAIADSGITVSFAPGTSDMNVTQPPPSYVDGLAATDMTIEYLSFDKYPRASFSTLVPPPSENMYLPAHVVVHSRKLNMMLEGRYRTPAPVAQLPIEYFEGPALWNGTFLGAPAQGVGILESTLALYRDWELAWVLRESVAHLAPTAFSPGMPRDSVVRVLEELQALVSDSPADDHRIQARAFNMRKVQPALDTITDADTRAKMLLISTDFDASLDLVLES